MRPLARALVFGLILTAGNGTAIASPPAVKIAYGKAEVLLTPDKFTCATSNAFDAADSPLRAYRDSSGAVHGFLVNYRNFSFVGTSLDALARPQRNSCGSLVPSANSADPSTFTNLQWVANPYTIDGKTVYAVVHNEFHGSTFSKYVDACPKIKRASARSCWYGSITLYKSEDGGMSFSPAQPFVIAASLSQFQVGSMRRGPFAQTNIFQNPHDKMYYMLMSMNREASPGAGKPGESQKPGVCLMRSADLQNWRFWDGSSFSVEIGSPYKLGSASVSRTCAPVIGASTILRSVVYYPSADVFVGVGLMRGQPFYTTSKDLLTWSEAAPITAAELSGVQYFSLLDPKSSARNFDTVGDNPNLYIVHNATDPSGRAMRGRREVLKLPVTLGIPH